MPAGRERAGGSDAGADPLGHGPGRAPRGVLGAGLAHPGGAGRRSRAARARREAGAVPRAGRRRDARGPGRGGLHQQPRGGEAARLRRVPGQGRARRPARRRALRQERSRAARGACPARRAAPRTGGPCPRMANLATGLGLVGLLAALVLTAPRWARLMRSRPRRPPRRTRPCLVGSAKAATPEADAERTINVKLYFEVAGPSRDWSPRTARCPSPRPVAPAPDRGRRAGTWIDHGTRGARCPRRPRSWTSS